MSLIADKLWKLERIFLLKLFYLRSFLGRYCYFSRFGRLEHWLFVTLVSRFKNIKLDSFWFPDRRGNFFLLNPKSFIDANILLTGDYEKSLQKFINAQVNPGNICFDVGANIGVMTLNFASRVKSGGRVYAFEPIPKIFEALNQNVKRNNLSETVLSYQLALSNIDGERLIHTFQDDFENQGMSSLVSEHFPDLNQKMSVNSTTIDLFVSKYNIQKIDFIKVDIQGAEGLFIQGARKTLSQSSAVLLMEISALDLMENKRTPQSIFQELFNLGYRNFCLLGKNGEYSKQIEIQQVSDQFSASVVVCRK